MFQDRSTNSETKNNLRYLARDMYISRTMTPQFPTRSHLTHLPPCMLHAHSSQQSMQQHSSGARAQCELLAGARPRLSVRLVCSGCSLLGSPNAAGLVATGGAAAVEQATALISSIGTGGRARRRGISLSS
jgi:hypothetical protein